ncbi:S-adenosyl-L-methionine-dependent methyltransferase, partial [Kalaharituber pfeilii]
SSVFSFTYANGRRYHSDRFKAQYFLPNDEQEQDRLDLFHHIFLSLLGGKLYTAPLHAIELHRVLDVGTGTGIWAIDFADEFPQVEVIGPDLSPIQPNWVPPNCKFEVDDLEGVWTYKDNYFDYIHMRSMSGSFRDWPLVLKQVYRTTVPGGYFEYQDYGSEAFKTDGTKLVGVDDEHPLSTYLHHVITVSEELGTPLVMARKMEELIKEAGFEDVRVQTAVWPVGDWPKDKRLKQIGRFARQGVLDSLYPFGVHILTKKGWTVEEVKELCQKA